MDDEPFRDPVLSDTAALKAWTVDVEEGQAPAFMTDLVNRAKEDNTQVIVTRADMVFGADHLRSALYHAKRSLREGTNASDSLAMETLLYASGERQLSSAIAKMSVNEQTKEIVVARLSDGPLPVQKSWQELGAKPAEGHAQQYLAFGITAQELEAQGLGKAVELVLERVAAVDILKK